MSNSSSVLAPAGRAPVIQEADQHLSGDLDIRHRPVPSARLGDAVAPALLLGRVRGAVQGPASHRADHGGPQLRIGGHQAGCGRGEAGDPAAEGGYFALVEALILVDLDVPGAALGAAGPPYAALRT
ncbi:hypothetical protein ACIQUW_31960 [Streptomyces sp. NPDC101117]|uniref:hypothetical protein n=1 Tax=Streptomyces sp. NPDC101117 TaxID=3366108 RepID=UPI003809805B